MKKPLLFALAIAAFAVPASAADGVTAVSKVFSQTVGFTLPSQFVTKFEDSDAKRYIREAVIKGETVDKWTQMITITGDRNGSAQGVSPKDFAEAMAGGFKKACPASFNAAALGSQTTSGYPSYAAILSCGTSPTTDGKTSETAIVLVIAAKRDIYTLQWAVRTAPSSGPMQFDTATWKARLAKLQPIDIE